MQGVVRRVVAQVLRTAQKSGFSADELEAAKIEQLEKLRPLIAEAEKAWQKEAISVVLNESSIYWQIEPRMDETKGDGPIVTLHWGWDEDSPPRVTSTANMAIDMAFEILGLFTKGETEQAAKLEALDEQFERIVEPERENPKGLDMSSDGFWKQFHEDSAEFMEATGNKGGCSLLEVSVWTRLGKPAEVPKHEWVDYPEDNVKVCSACHHWFWTDDTHDDWPVGVCPGEPIDDDRIKSTDVEDPRRSPQLREAQRLQRLAAYMKHGGAKETEIEPVLDDMSRFVERLSSEEKSRYDKERVGV